MIFPFWCYPFTAWRNCQVYEHAQSTGHGGAIPGQRERPAARPAHTNRGPQEAGQGQEDFREGDRADNGKDRTNEGG